MSSIRCSRPRVPSRGHIARTDATVGALRARARGHDITTRSTAVLEHDTKIRVQSDVEALAKRLLESNRA